MSEKEVWSDLKVPFNYSHLSIHHCSSLERAREIVHIFLKFHPEGKNLSEEKNTKNNSQRERETALGQTVCLSPQRKSHKGRS